MPVIAEVKMFRTVDGVLHCDIESARRHDKVLDLTDELPRLDLSMSDDRKEMAEWILDNFEVMK